MNNTSNFTTCPAASSINFTTTYYMVGGEGAAAVFSNTAPIVRGHDIPRFGHTNNITLVMSSGSREESKSYLVGLLSGSIAIFCIFVVWLAVVILMRCLGYKVVGFWSGSNVRWPTRPVAVPTTEPVLNDGSDAEAIGQEAMKESGNSGDEVDARRGELKKYSPDENFLHDTLNSDDDEDATDTTREQAQGEISQMGSEHEIAISQPTDSELELKEWERKVKATERLVLGLRVAVILSGLVIVAMAILMVVYGVKGLHSSVLDGKRGLVQGQNLAYSGVGLINSYMDQQNATLVAAQGVVAGSNETICPQAKEIICPNSDVDCSVFDGHPFVATVEQLYSQLTDTQHDLNEAAALMNDVNEYIDKFTWAFWVAAAMVLLYAICTLIILNGVVLAWQKKLHGTCWQRTTSRFRGWCVVPVFVVLLILGWIFSMVFVIGSAASGDFCYDSPDENVVVLLNKFRDNFSTNSLLYLALEFYIFGCPANSTVLLPLPTEMLNVTALVSYLEALNQEIVVVSSNSEEIAAVCGTDPETLQSAIKVLASQVCTIATTVTDLVEYFSCSNFNSVYSTIAYDAFCYNGNAGLSAITITQFIILLCAMVMLTLRAAFYEVGDESEIVEPPHGCCSCCRHANSYRYVWMD